MICKSYDIKNDNSLETAHADFYMLGHSEQVAVDRRPVVVVCPGGAYKFICEREAEPIALAFVGMGYHAVVSYYSAPALFPTALLELGRTVQVLREHADEYLIDTDRIYIAGFSAGGHLAASYGVFWKREWFSESLKVSSDQLKPRGLILGYPGITPNARNTRPESYLNLLGDAVNDPDKCREQAELELHVTADMPHAFIWHTFDDVRADVHNSLLLVNEMVRQNIPVEFHMFEKGGHGLALGTRLTVPVYATKVPQVCPPVAKWVEMVHFWLENDL